MMRAAIIVLALMLAVASAGMALCEMDCAAGGHAASATAMMEHATSAATSHCDGEQMDSAQHDAPAQHGSSSGNTKHGVHLHPRIVATASARIQISPKRAFSDIAVNSAAFGSGIFARVEGNLWNHSSSPPINFLPVFSTGVLRI
jgi:hypothetical protein